MWRLSHNTFVQLLELFICKRPCKSPTLRARRAYDGGHMLRAVDCPQSLAVKFLAGELVRSRLSSKTIMHAAILSVPGARFEKLGVYSVFAHRRAIWTNQAALIIMCDWLEPLFSIGYSETKQPSVVQRRYIVK